MRISRALLIAAGLVVASLSLPSDAQTYHGKGVPYDSATGFGAMGNNATANSPNLPSDWGPPWGYTLTIQQKWAGIDMSTLTGLGSIITFNTYDQPFNPPQHQYIADFASYSEVPTTSVGSIYDFWGFNTDRSYEGKGFLTEMDSFVAGDFFNGSGGGSHLRGFKSVPFQNTGTTMNDVVGFYARPDTGGTAGFTAGFEADAPSGDTATTNYGLYVHDQTGSGSATNYNIYSAGNGANWLNSGVQFGKITDPGTAPGAAKLALRVVAGTNAGTCKIIAYAGTSTTPVTIADNVGSGC